jgi:two-component sensor histidine kinase
MAAKSVKQDVLQAEIARLQLLAQAGLNSARLSAQAGLDATESEAARRLQRLLLEELHHRIKNTLATVIAITSQSLRNAESLEQGRLAVESGLLALGCAHDLLLHQTGPARSSAMSSAPLSSPLRIIRFGDLPFRTPPWMSGRTRCCP